MARIKYKHDLQTRLMAAEYLCRLLGMAYTEADIRAVAETGGSGGSTWRLAKGQLKRVEAARRILTEKD